MASAIDPDKKPNRAAKPGDSEAALANPAAARPAAPRPAVRPAPAPQPQQPAQSEQPEELGRDRKPGVGASLLKQTPAWAVSMIVHVVALLAMALIVTEPPKKEATVSIVSTAPEEEEAFEEIKEDLPDTPVETTDPVTDIAVSSDVAVEDVTVVADSNDVDAAPLAVDMSEFGDITAPASDMMSTIGAIGGTGKGFGGRKNAGALAAAGGGGGETESAVDRALKWFIEHQLDDGSWDLNLVHCPKCKGKCSNKGMRYVNKAGFDTGLRQEEDPNNAPSADRSAPTGLAILPFLGRGYTHQDGPYQKQLEAGVMYLARLSAQNQGKIITDKANMYSQGIATMALSEAYAMTQDERLEAPAQLALDFLKKCQCSDGGWYYTPRQCPIGDTSIFGWQFMALKSGYMANLKVDPATIKNATKYLDSVEEDSGVFYKYKAETPAGQKRPATTAIGLLSRMYSGWDHDHPSLERGVAFLSQQQRETGGIYFQYYATQVVHQYGGEAWQTWNANMKNYLLPIQATQGHEAGSWHDKIGNCESKTYGGRLLCTSMATMMLEVYYRHMPIYREQAAKTKR